MSRCRQHVLDEELLAQKGFQTSELLMADSVTLLRRKIEHSSLAVQDGTMNSVITLAAIEVRSDPPLSFLSVSPFLLSFEPMQLIFFTASQFGKGNIKVSEKHVDGAKRLVNMRGGINSVRQTSPLTARMVSW